MGRIFLFRNRYYMYIDWIRHWGPFGHALKLYGVKFIPFEQTLAKTLIKYGWAWRPPVFHIAYSGTIKSLKWWGGGFTLRLIVGRETVQKHVVLFCLTGSRKASTALTMAKPSLSGFPCFVVGRDCPPPPNWSFRYLRFITELFCSVLCCAKSKIIRLLEMYN